VQKRRPGTPAAEAAARALGGSEQAAGSTRSRDPLTPSDGEAIPADLGPDAGTISAE
jgi:hypothetical protein